MERLFLCPKYSDCYGLVLDAAWFVHACEIREVDDLVADTCLPLLLLLPLESTQPNPNLITTTYKARDTPTSSHRTAHDARYARPALMVSIICPLT